MNSRISKVIVTEEHYIFRMSLERTFNMVFYVFFSWSIYLKREEWLKSIQASHFLFASYNNKGKNEPCILFPISLKAPNARCVSHENVPLALIIHIVYTFIACIVHRWGSSNMLNIESVTCKNKKKKTSSDLNVNMYCVYFSLVLN